MEFKITNTVVLVLIIFSMLIGLDYVGSTQSVDGYIVKVVDNGKTMGLKDKYLVDVYAYEDGEYFTDTIEGTKDDFNRILDKDVAKLRCRLNKSTGNMTLDKGNRLWVYFGIGLFFCGIMAMSLTFKEVKKKKKSKKKEEEEISKEPVEESNEETVEEENKEVVEEDKGEEGC